MKNTDQPLKVEIKNDLFVISVGVDTLCYAIQAGPEWPANDDGGPLYKITDNLGFAKEIVDECEKESEDGTTIVAEMFDTTSNNAIDMGSMFIEEIKYESKED